MVGFAEETMSRVLEALEVPDALRMLFEWIEAAGFVERGQDGEQYGALSSGWPNGPGTNVLFRGWTPAETDQIAAWFGPLRDGLPTVWPFCRTGADGSTAALWRAPDGRVRIVHMGSGSGSLLTCVLGETAVDFLRLIAIGYDEVCWNEDWHVPPSSESGRSTFNEPYRHWVESTFDTTIPATAIEIVPVPAEMGDVGTGDPWCEWVNAAS